MQNTAVYNERLKSLALEQGGSSSPCPRLMSSSSLQGYSDEMILCDARLAVESVLRKKGLLQSNTYAITEMLRQVEPPTKPRPEMNSQIQLA